MIAANTVQKNSEFAKLISRMNNDLKDLQEKNELVMRKFYNEMENQKTREEIKKQSERGIELAKLHFDKIQNEMRR